MVPRVVWVTCFVYAAFVAAALAFTTVGVAKIAGFQRTPLSAAAAEIRNGLGRGESIARLVTRAGDGIAMMLVCVAAGGLALAPAISRRPTAARVVLAFAAIAMLLGIASDRQATIQWIVAARHDATGAQLSQALQVIVDAAADRSSYPILLLVLCLWPPRDGIAAAGRAAIVLAVWAALDLYAASGSLQYVGQLYGAVRISERSFVTIPDEMLDALNSRRSAQARLVFGVVAATIAGAGALAAVRRRASLSGWLVLTGLTKLAIFAASLFVLATGVFAEYPMPNRSPAWAWIAAYAGHAFQASLTSLPIALSGAIAVGLGRASRRVTLATIEADGRSRP